MAAGHDQLHGQEAAVASVFTATGPGVRSRAASHASGQRALAQGSTCATWHHCKGDAMRPRVPVSLPPARRVELKRLMTSDMSKQGQWLNRVWRTGIIQG